jgi:cellulose synthase/poly-beta-1,6-N-acetylglucosamine synthase-like glycosyltransferase
MGYPCLAAFLSIFINRPVRKSDFTPQVTILIAAHNEQECIRKTIENKLSLDYPTDKIEIIVVSDGSTDKSDEIVKSFASKSVKLLRQEPRAGKTSAINRAVREATGEILVFSDANSIYAPDALIKLLQNFADPDVGYVTGKMIYTNPDGSPIGDGCTAYMKYENCLRRIETRMGSIVGVDGGIDAARKEIYRPMNPDQLPDFVLPLRVIEQGYRVIYEPEAILKEPSLKAPKDEYKMRVRVSLRALWALWDMRHLLTFTRSLPSSSGAPSPLRPLASSFLYSWQLWSHKVLRYLCFMFLVTAYFSNLALWQEGSFYKFFFILQNLYYLCGIVFPLLNKKGYISQLLYLFNYFVLLNLASAHAFIKFILRQKQVIWTPRKG